MNVYDFDHTVYRGDCSLDFFIFRLKRHPETIFFLPIQFFAFIAEKIGFIGTKRGKELFFCFLRFRPATQDEIRLFWTNHICRIQEWYLARKRESDVFVSASPAFLLNPLVTQQWKLRLLATEMDPNSGVIFGENCKGKEKVRRFLVCFQDTTVDEFYSDSLSDAPLAEIAEKSFLVRGTQSGPPRVLPWPPINID